MPNSSPIDLRFEEKMTGYMHFFDDLEKDFSFDRAAYIAQQMDSQFYFKLKISIPNLDSFISDPKHTAKVSGIIYCDEFNGECSLLPESRFEVFAKNEGENDVIRYMNYYLHFNYNSKRYTFFGKKIISKNDDVDSWNATTKLYCSISCETNETKGSKVIAKGILKLSLKNLLNELQTFKTSGKSLLEKNKRLATFMKFFMGNLWDQKKFNVIPKRLKQKHYPVFDTFTDIGVTDCDKRSIAIETPDGLGLTMERYLKTSTNDVVLLLHGLTTSTDMFIMPEHQNIVTYLHKNGFGDVWSLDWRGSMRHHYNLIPSQNTVDDVALFDIPCALAKIRNECGPSARVHVICHCVGSISFFMTLCSGLAGEIASVTSNSVSIMQQVAKWSQFKLNYAPFFISNFTPFNYLLPSFSKLSVPPWNPQKLLARAVGLFHPESSNSACHMLSFMWGSGNPACYSLENLDKKTYARIGDLFGGVGVNYYKHLAQMVKHGSSVTYSDNIGRPQYSPLSSNYLQDAGKLKVPILLITGSDNHVFENSNSLAYEYLKSKGVACELRVIPNYGHQDTFMGKNSASDIFPYILKFLKKESGSAKVTSIEKKQLQG